MGRKAIEIKMDKKELLKHIGSIEQIGGIKDYTINDGKAKGVRAIDINTGVMRFTIIPDRCLDIAQADFKGSAISWISKTGITAPEYYEKDGRNFLRGFFGGLVTTCGLKNIGRPTETQGLHGRIANTPAKNVCVWAGWEGDDYVMKVSGEMRECSAFGENLVLKRTISAKLFDATLVLEDKIINEGFKDEDIALCYHCNFGYPLVSEKSRITNIPEELASIDAPSLDAKEQCIEVDLPGDTVTVGIENEKIGAYLTYKTKTLPRFIAWKMLSVGAYAVGLEPRTSNFGGENIAKNNEFVTLKPFEEYETGFSLTIKDL